MRKWIVIPVVAAALGATACTGDDGDSGGGGSAEQAGPSVMAPGKPGEPNRTLSAEEAKSAVPDNKPNDADFAFMRDMVLHHSQAVEMTALAEDRAAARPVKGIAGRIAGAQAVEIKAMNLWLKRNGHEPLMVPGAKGYDPDADHGGHDGHGGHASMPGMASEQEMAALAKASGKKFDQLFLKLMIVHHEGALTMASEVQRKGADQRVQELADDIIASQSAEIAKMKAMRNQA